MPNQSGNASRIFRAIRLFSPASGICLIMLSHLYSIKSVPALSRGFREPRGGSAFSQRARSPHPGTQSSTAWAIEPASTQIIVSSATFSYSTGSVTKPVSSSTAGQMFERVT